MPLPETILWQFWLCCFRFVITCVSFLFDWDVVLGTKWEIQVLSLCLIGILALNDLGLLVWDVYFSGSIVSTIGFQTITSLLFIIFLSVFIILPFVGIASQGGLIPLGLLLVFNIPAIISNVVVFGFTARAWYRGPERAWKLGVKEISHRNHGTTRFTKSRLSIFGTRRGPDDSIRKIWPEAMALLRSAFIRGLRHIRRSLKLIITRKTMEVETSGFALWRNISAVLLVSILVAQSVRQLLGVVHDKFGIQETWDSLGVDLSVANIEIYTENNSPESWNIYMTQSDSNVSLSDITAHENEFGFSQLSLTTGFYRNPPSNGSSAENQVYNIAMVANSTNPSGPGKLWLGMSDGFNIDAAIDTDVEEFYHIGCSICPAVLQFGVSFQLIVGSNKIGVLEVTERRTIIPSVFEMMGLRTTYNSIAMISVQWTDEFPLGNKSVAQAALYFDRHFDGNKTNAIETVLPLQYRVITDYRRHTFLDALSSIGGLLATVQGLHILLFGQPLWWGIFGSKLVNPFGIFGAISSRRIRDRMIARYGHIPNASNMNSSGAHRLSLFLNDFVINFGPLRKWDEDAMDAEQGNVGDLSHDSMNVLRSGQGSEVTLGEPDDWDKNVYGGDSQSHLPLARMAS